MSHSHPIIAAIYDRMSEAEERAFLGRVRSKLLARATGTVVEVGAGTGRNLPYYRPGAVREVVAVEPDPHMKRRAHARLAAAPVPVRPLEAVAERLPLDDGFADTVVATLVLCSVDDPEASVREIRRVLKPGGMLLFVEHVRSDEQWRGRLQDFVTPAWRRLAANCHPNRATLTLLRDGGLKPREEERLAVGAPWVQPVVAGFATRP